MTSSAQLGARYRSLLIGIDAYPKHPLRGCVNDIDAVQRILLNKLGVPAAHIQRLASPHEGVAHEDAVPAQPATLANIRTAFTRLANETREGERVFIYYSGHGTRLKLKHPGERAAYREALVPVDFNATPGYALLFDYELNQLLGKITAISGAVACVLDCCHAAGATRGKVRSSGPTARYLDLPGELPAPEGCPPPTVGARGADAARGDGLARTVDSCQVVAACMNHEVCWESTGSDGTRRGRLTRAFERAVLELDKSELHTAPWLRIWQAMRVEVESQNPAQHLWMHGHPGRAVFAGPPVEGDPGLAIRRAGEAYEIAAGTLASITEGALVAVYGEKPPYFPPLGSPEDLQQRRGLLRVSSATLSSARAVPEDPSFQLPAVARGRLVEPGEASRLRCGIVPWSNQLAGDLRESPLLEVVREGAPVRLEQAGDRWHLLDDLHDTPERALFTFAHAYLHRARDVLDHYFSYALPLRLALSIGDMSTLRLCLLACPDDVAPERAQDPDLAEASTSGSSTYDLAPSDRVCFRVYNAKLQPLRVTLLNSASSGKVQILGDQVIDGMASHVFWSKKGLGKPFTLTLPAGKSGMIERLVAVGTTQLDRDLSFLLVGRGFAETIDPVRGSAAKDFDGEDDAKEIANVEQWTATPVIVRVGTARTS